MEDSIDPVLLAIPSLSRSERRRIVDRFQRLGVPMLQLPSVDDLTSGARIDALRPIGVKICSVATRFSRSDCLALAFVMRWSASPVLVAQLVQSFVVRSWRLSPARLILLGQVNSALCHRAGAAFSVAGWRVLQPVLGSADPQLLQRLFADQAVRLVLRLAGTSPWWRPILAELPTVVPPIRCVAPASPAAWLRWC